MKKIPVLFSLALLVIFGIVYIRSVRDDHSYRPIVSHPDVLSFDAEIDMLAREMTAVRGQIPAMSVIATDTLRDCDLMRKLFAEAFVPSPNVRIDFILRIHQDPMGQIPVPKYPESKNLVEKTIQRNSYDMVGFEGCAFDGFSLESKLRETYSRLYYTDPQTFTPTVREWHAKGLLRNYETVRPHLVRFFEGAPRSEVDDLHDFERHSKSSFIAGELATLTVLMGYIESRRLTSPNIGSLVKTIHRLRSAYATATLLKRLKDTHATHGALVYGYLHDTDFVEISSKLGLQGRLCNATSYAWDELAKMR